MYKLMEDAKAMAACRKEVEEVMEAKRCGDEPEADFTAEDINNMPIIGELMHHSCDIEKEVASGYLSIYNIFIDLQ